jgi:peptide/nickel transport system substrate-binding protein
MNHNSSFSIPRFRLWAGVVFLSAVFLGWAATDHAAQNQQPDKKRTEEEDDMPAKPAPKRKIRIEDEDPNAKPSRPIVSASGDLAELARQSNSKAVQNLYRKLAVPFDLLTTSDPKNLERATPTKRLEPLEKFYGSDRSKLSVDIQVIELNAENKPQQPTTLNGNIIKSIQPYELVALNELDLFRKGKIDVYKNQPGVYEQLLAEEQVLSAVLRFHGSAKETGRRKGKEWDEIQDRLRDELLKVLLKQLAELTKEKEWDAAFALALRMADSFPGEVEQQVLAPKILDLLLEARAANKATLSLKENHTREMYLRLRGLIAKFPSNPQIQELSKSLKAQAQVYYDEAKAKASSGRKEDIAKAQDLLRQAEDIWPSLEGSPSLRQEWRLKYPILRVGIRQPLPKYLSPNMAVTDAELRAVELQFESLVKFTPDATGIGRFQPGLAEGRPSVIELGREFQLPANALWSDKAKDHPLLELNDIRATFHALKEGRGAGSSLAWQNLFRDAEVSVGSDSFRIKVNLAQGCIEPLALMNVKIVPASALRRGQEEPFGLNPIGSGPFSYDGIRSEQGRSCAVFVTNPNYGTRASKLGLPHLREVRFFQYATAQEELGKQQLEMLLDLTAQEAALIREKQADNHFNVLMPNPRQVNHRVYFLAVNHRKVPLDDENLRSALSAAINREKILNDHFRGEFKKIHKAINSPYPANCWAADPKLRNRTDRNSCDPFDLALAKKNYALAAKKLPQSELTLDLKYPGDDKLLESALKDLATQVHDALHVKLNLVRCDPRDLQVDVEKTFNYDLAYYHYDFPDDTFYLGPLLGPRRLGQDEVIDNLFGYKSPDDLLPHLLQQSMDHREFAEIQKYTREIHKALLRETPVIPLWQLDPLHAIHKDVKAPPFDPQRVFTDIERWQLERTSE